MFVSRTLRHWVLRTLCSGVFFAGGFGCGCSQAGDTSASGAGLRSTAGRVKLRLLAFNDFHGRLSAERSTVSGKLAGGAVALASQLRAAQRATSAATFIVHAGDMIGASPAISALLQDEPTVEFFNLLGNEHCRAAAGDTSGDRDRCNLIAALGNHEFDEGIAELLRLIRGGEHAHGPFLQHAFRGAGFPLICANVVWEQGGQPLLPASVVRDVEGVTVAFVGVVTRTTPQLVMPEAVAGLRFEDEALAVNREVKRLRRRGVEAIVVVMHEGAEQPPYAGPTRADVQPPAAKLAHLVAQFDGAVDVVISGHAHAFTNALLPNAAGHKVLVTQAWAAGKAYADINVQLDRRTGDVVQASAQIVPVQQGADHNVDRATRRAGDDEPSVHAVASLVRQAQTAVQAVVSAPVATLATALPVEPNRDGESLLGDVVADAQRAALGADVALMNDGGLRADLAPGSLTWGDLFTVQPFNNQVLRLTLSGAQLRETLEQQWPEHGRSHGLQVSGLRYRWDGRAPHGARVVALELNDGSPILPEQRYTVAVNSFLATGANGFTALSAASERVVGPSDMEALLQYLRTAPQPLTVRFEQRIVRIDGHQ